MKKIPLTNVELKTFREFLIDWSWQVFPAEKIEKFLTEEGFIMLCAAESVAIWEKEFPHILFEKRVRGCGVYVQFLGRKTRLAPKTRKLK